ncbi:hypothetical protein [Solitalea lacus]|uniref:hypothetical protein n=1 Tax=Solitalea lacus TaxID=2911172 RepID=UPI001EDC563A|nr:hypothetical protein [Solitalea lacus]UKJ08641.1 hypothetical protein L2B55_05600 [Solitalea lacus]
MLSILNIQGLLKLDQEIYPMEYYEAIKGQFGLMIKKQNEPIVLKLKSSINSLKNK